MSGGDLGLVVAIVVLVATAGFLALAETALTHMSRVKAMALAEEGRRGAERLRRLVEHPERALNPVLLLVLVCHLAAATFVGVVTERHFGAAGVAVGLVVEVVFIFVLAEAVPKTWAVQHVERAALLAAPVIAAIASFPPIRLLARGLIGLANVILPGRGLPKGPFVSEEELLATVDMATEEEVIERDERELIHSILEFSDTVVREVMVPRPDMVTVESRARVADAFEVASASGYSRIPVYDQTVDDVCGIVYAKDLMRALRDDKGDEPVRAFARPAHFVPETKRVAALMREMQAEKYHMAIVVDEYGGTAGLVTLEDLIEELVGEIVDEFDVEEPLVEALPGGEVRVDGRMLIDEVNELLHAELPDGDWDTIAGFVFNLLGHVPAEGETVEWDGHRFRAEKVQGRRIGRVRISPLTPPDPGDAGSA